MEGRRAIGQTDLACGWVIASTWQNDLVTSDSLTHEWDGMTPGTQIDEPKLRIN
jgi:hypothetical protein